MITMWVSGFYNSTRDERGLQFKHKNEGKTRHRIRGGGGRKEA